MQVIHVILLQEILVEDSERKLRHYNYIFGLNDAKARKKELEKSISALEMQLGQSADIKTEQKMYLDLFPEKNIIKESYFNIDRWMKIAKILK